jgi:cell division protein FtsB
MGGELRPESGRSERCERLAGALARLSNDLADARREIVVLKRENAALRRRVAYDESGGSAGDAPGAGRDGLSSGFVAVRGGDG